MFALKNRVQAADAGSRRPAARWRKVGGPALARRAGVMIVAVSGLLLIMASAASADAAADRREQVRYGKETMELGNGQFMQRKANFLAAGCQPGSQCLKPSPYNRFDWTTDSCSGTPTSLKALFDPACQQHDFGYRNFGKGLTLGRDENTRRWIDDRFRAEMKAICNYKFSDWTQYANLQACFKEADIMYAFVRVLSDWSKALVVSQSAAAPTTR